MRKRIHLFSILTIAVFVAIFSVPVERAYAVTLGAFVRHEYTTDIHGMSDDGRYLVMSGNVLLPGETSTNGWVKIFIRDTVQNITTRITVSPTGALPNGDSYAPSISADGRFVTFYSYATNLVSTSDTNGNADVFLYDRVLNKLTMQSTNSGGVQANGVSKDSFISKDGEYLLFTSTATNLGSSTATNHVYIKNLITHTLTYITVNQLGASGSGFKAAMSADNEYIVFESPAVNTLATPSNPTIYDNNGKTDVFRYATRTKTFELVSQTQNGGYANGHSGGARISSDGRYVSFYSTATNLTSTLTNPDLSNIYVRDMQTGTTELITKDWQSTGSGDKSSGSATISGDGRYILFGSQATNLIENDVSRGYSSAQVTRTYLRDRSTGTTKIVSVADENIRVSFFADYSDSGLAINGPGTLIAFGTIQRLTPEDTDNRLDTHTRALSN